MNEDIKKLLEVQPHLEQMHGPVKLVRNYPDYDIILFEDGFVFVFKHPEV